MQDAGNYLRREARGGNRELEWTGRNSNEGELAVIAGDGFDDYLGCGFAARQFQACADDGCFAFVRDLAGDRARRCDRSGGASLSRLMNGRRLRLSLSDRGKGTEPDA
jgi:hypothetical protein